MSAKVIDGKVCAALVEEEIRQELSSLAARGVRPGLIAVRVGDDPASEVYVRSKAKKAEDLGLNGRQLHLPADTTEHDLLEIVRQLNADDTVDGILVQLPLPGAISAGKVIEAIAPEKDVDGFHPVNAGLLQEGRAALVPCTPLGVIRLIDSTGMAIDQAHAVVIGRSAIVGKPVAALLLQRNATVTVAHSRTTDLTSHLKTADIVVAAAGRPHLIKGSMLKPGACVIDVGINRVDSSHDVISELPQARREIARKNGSILVGDVDFSSAGEIAGWITPVPGGVGPMTIMMLMKNTVVAAKRRRGWA